MSRSATKATRLLEIEAMLLAHPEGLGAEELEELLFPKRAPTAGRNIPQPDCATFQKETR